MGLARANSVITAVSDGKPHKPTILIHGPYFLADGSSAMRLGNHLDETSRDTAGGILAAVAIGLAVWAFVIASLWS